MSCSVCAGYDSFSCPCCGENYSMIPCPDCTDGFEYYSFNIHTGKQKKVTKAAYMILPYDEDDARDGGMDFCQGDVCECSRCGGEREIPRIR